MSARRAAVSRTTRETRIQLRLNLDGAGRCRLDTGLPFLDHMLELFARHGLLDLELRARGDLRVDAHHTVEDIGLCLGTALDRALGARRGIARYGCVCLPMDDALSRVALDLGGRPFLVYRVPLRQRRIGAFDIRLVPEFLRAFCVQGRLNLHVACLYGSEPHHALESVFKGLARALRQAAARDPRERGVPSSKGRL